MRRSIKEIKVISNAHWEKIKKVLVGKGYSWNGETPIDDYPILEKTDFPFYINIWRNKTITWCYADLVEAIRTGNIIEVENFNDILEYPAKILSD